MLNNANFRRQLNCWLASTFKQASFEPAKFINRLAGCLTRAKDAASPSQCKQHTALTFVSKSHTTYDTAGRKKTEALTISGQTYTTTSGYNSRGELTSLTYPDSTVVDREYTDRGELYRLGASPAR